MYFVRLVLHGQRRQYVAAWDTELAVILDSLDGFVRYHKAYIESIK